MKAILIALILSVLIGCGASILVPADGSSDFNGGAYGHSVGVC